jgi:uncharacterized protein YdeI (YjbR/CyaY-like superfamily)
MASSAASKVPSGRIPAVDFYIAKSASFAKPILLYLRDIVHDAVPEVSEEMKWSRPFFVHRGVILGNIAAFKEHCSFGIWGAELAEKLRTDGVASAEGMGTFGRITNVKDLPARKQLIGYLKGAAKLIDEGTRTKAWERPKVVKAEVEVPDALAAALKKNKAAAKSFEAMSPSCRREYVEWIADAKRDETKAKRVETAIEWIAEGKSRNWKYEKRA